MSDPIIIAIITAIPPADVVAFAAFFQSLKTHRLVNSRMSELLRLSNKEAAEKATKTERSLHP